MTIGTPLEVSTIINSASGSAAAYLAGASTGSLLTAFIGCATANAHVTACSDDAGNNYGLASAHAAASRPSCECWYIYNCKATTTANKLTITTSSGNFSCIACATTGAAILDVSTPTSNSSSEKTFSLASGTLAKGEEIVFGATAALGSLSGWTDAAPFTNIDKNLNATLSMAVSRDIVASTASVTWNPTWTTSHSAMNGIWSFEGGGALTAAAGSFVLNGIAATLVHGLQLTQAAGAFVLSGVAASLAKGRVLTAAVGAFTLSGIAASFSIGHTLTAAVGAFTLNGVAAALVKGRQLTMAAGSFALNGIAATLVKGRNLTAAAGSFALSGVAAALTRGRQLAMAAGSFILSGIDAILTWMRSGGRQYALACSAGNFAYAGAWTYMKVIPVLIASAAQPLLYQQIVFPNGKIGFIKIG